MNYKTLGKFLIVDIHKPMSSQDTYDFCRVRKDYFDKAKTIHRNVVVRTPNGERVFDPSKMKEFKIVKEVFLFPDRPMELYELVITKVEKKPDEFYEFT